MMLPILISVSVTPASYFFCASEGAVARLRRTAESASFRTRCGRVKRVRTNGFAQRFMKFPLWARLNFYVGSFLSAFLLQFFWSVKDSSRTGGPEATRPSPGKICRVAAGQAPALRIFQRAGGM